MATTLRIADAAICLHVQSDVTFHSKLQMTKPPSFDPIDYLFHRKYPIGNGPFPGWNGTGLICPELYVEIIRYNEEMDDFAKELSSKTPAEIEELVKAEKERERQQAEEEGRRFYNLPSARADFDHYCKAAFWTLDECVALSFGKDPERVNRITVQPYASSSPFAHAYEKLRDLTKRAMRADELTDPVSPSIYLAWAKERNVALSDELVSHAVNSGLSLESWRDRFEEQKDALRDATSEIERLRDQQAAHQTSAQASDSNSQLGTRERESLLKLVASMAISQYDFDPRQGRNAATKYIWEDMQSLGLSMDEDTVRKHLKQGAELIPGDALENLKPKPNSGKR